MAALWTSIASGLGIVGALPARSCPKGRFSAFPEDARTPSVQACSSWQCIEGEVPQHDLALIAPGSFLVFSGAGHHWLQRQELQNEQGGAVAGCS